MSIDRDIALLRGIATFDLLSDGAVRMLASGAEEMHLADGDVLFRAGEASNGAYVVVSGRLKMLDARPPAAPRLLKEVGAGALVGEIALMIETPRPATAVAEGETVVIRLPREVFVRLLERYPEVTAKFRRAIARRLEGTLRALDGVRVKLEEHRQRRRR